MFYSSEGYALRILIDSDGILETGYSLPGLGADRMIEVYGKNQAILSSVLYAFNDNREKNDWNAFNALSTIDARTLGNNIEAQVPHFDLGTIEGSQIKIAWQSSDNIDSVDLADTVMCLKCDHFLISDIVDQLITESNSVNEGEGIVIDGHFEDWNSVEKQFNIASTAVSEHVDLENYAAIKQNEENYMYLSVKGNVLNGISIPAYSAKSMPEFDLGNSNVNDNIGNSNQESTPLPVLANEDSIYILIAVSYTHLTLPTNREV